MDFFRVPLFVDVHLEVIFGDDLKTRGGKLFPVDVNINNGLITFSVFRNASEEVSDDKFVHLCFVAC